MEILLLIICAYIFYQAAEMEDAPGWLWGSMSVGMYLLTSIVFGWWVIGCIAGQVALFFLITLFKMFRSSPAS